MVLKPTIKEADAALIPTEEAYISGLSTLIVTKKILVYNHNYHHHHHHHHIIITVIAILIIITLIIIVALKVQMTYRPGDSAPEL